MDFKNKLTQRIAFWLSLIGLIVIISDFGFKHSGAVQKILDVFYFIVLGIGLVAIAQRYLQNFKLIRRKVFVFDLLSVTFTLWVFYLYFFVGVPFKTDLLLENPIWVQMAVLLMFIREFSEQKINFNRTVINPAQLFILSFLGIIFIGTFLLLLPNATHTGLSFLDALFTSTSAVCVTGLVVVDTATHFTLFGQTIIMILIQLGGLGILTFASYFSYFFKGGTSYENQLALSVITNSHKLGEVFSTLKYIILITLGIELFSGILIYSSVDSIQFASHSEKLFFTTVTFGLIITCS